MLNTGIEDLNQVHWKFSCNEIKTNQQYFSNFTHHDMPLVITMSLSKVRKGKVGGNSTAGFSNLRLSHCISHDSPLLVLLDFGPSESIDGQTWTV